MEIKKTGVSATSFKMAVLSSAITLASCGGGGGGIDVIAPKVTQGTSSSGSGTSSGNQSGNGNQTVKTEADFFIQKLSVEPTKVAFTDKPVTFKVTARVSEVATGGAVAGKDVTLKLADAEKNGLSINGASTQQSDAQGVATFSVTLTPSAVEQPDSILKNGITVTTTAKRNNGEVKTKTSKITVSKSSSQGNGTDGEADFFIQKLVVDPTKVIFNDKPVTFEVAARVSEVSTGGAVSGKDVTLKLADAKKNGLSINGSSTQKSDDTGLAKFSVTLTPSAVDNIDDLIKNGISVSTTAMRDNGDVKTQTSKIAVSKQTSGSQSTVSELKLSATSNPVKANVLGDVVVLAIKAVNKNGASVSGQSVSLGINSIPSVSIDGGATKVTDGSGFARFNIAITDMTETQRNALIKNGITYTAVLTEENGAQAKLTNKINVIKPTSQFSLASTSNKKQLNTYGDEAIITVKASTSSSLSIAGSKAKIELLNKPKGVSVTSSNAEFDSSGKAVFNVIIDKGLSKDDRTTLALNNINFKVSVIEPNKSTTTLNGSLDVETPATEYFVGFDGVSSNLPSTGGNANVQVRVSDKNGGAVKGQKVTLALPSSVKDLVFIDTVSNQTTNEKGLATYIIRVPSSLTATQRKQLEDLGSITLNATLTEESGAQITVASNPVNVGKADVITSNNNLSIRSTKTTVSAAGDSFELIVQVKDEKNTAVANQTIKIFVPAAPGLSILTPTEIKTDDSGKAKFGFSVANNLSTTEKTTLASTGMNFKFQMTETNGAVKVAETLVKVADVESVPAKLNLLTSKELNTNGDTFELKAQVVDGSGKFVTAENVVLTFTDSNAGNISINGQPGTASISAITNDQGIVSYAVNVPNNLTVEQKKLLASSGLSGSLSYTDKTGQKVTQAVSLQFTSVGDAVLSMSHIFSSGSVNLFGDTVDVSVLVIDNKNNIVPDQEVAFSLSSVAVKNGVVLGSQLKQKTNNSGIAKYKLTVPSTLSKEQREALKKGIAFGYATKDSNGRTITGNGTVLTTAPKETNLGITLGSNKIVSVTGDTFKVFARVVDLTTKLPVANKEISLFVDEPLKTGVSITGSSNVKTNSDGVAEFNLTLTSGDNIDPKVLNAGINIRAKVQEDSGATTEQTYVVPVDQNSIENYLISYTASKQNFKTGGDEANITFRVADTNGGVLKNVPVVLSIEKPQVSGATLTTERELKTNDQGIVTTSVVLSNGSVDSRINHDIKLKATISRVEFDNQGNPSYSDAAVQEVKLIASGTSIDINSNQNNINPDDEVTITVVAKDGLSNTIAGANVVLQDGSGKVLETEVVTKDESGNVINKLNKPITNENGEVRLKLKEKNMPFDENGNAKVYAKIFGETQTQYQVSTSSVDFVAVDRSGISFIELDEAKGTPIGQDVTVKVQIRAKDSSGLSNLVDSNVTLETTLGKIKDANDLGVILSKKITSADVAAATGNSIVKEFTISSELAGTAGLIAKLENKEGKKVLEANAVLRFIATVPHKLLLQATDNVLVPGGSTEIVAIVKNKDDVPVENVKVIFTRLKDSSAGALSSAQAITNEKGEARVRYTAGASTPDKGVVLDAQIETDRTIESQPSDVSLTVSRQAAYLTIGLSDRLVSSEDNIYYSRATSASLVDASGRPVVNQPVSIKLFASRYALGCFGTRFIPGTTVTPGFFVWVQKNSTLYASEDKNRNFTLDKGEDGSNSIAVGSPGKVVALNGKLEPANPVTIIGGKLQGNTYTFVTDEQGKFDFNLRYPKTYAEWMELEISASSNVFGSETDTKTYFTLPVSAADITLSGSEQVRPNSCSPFNDAGYNP